MRALIALAMLIVALLGAGPASADPGAAGATASPYLPPFVGHTEWALWGHLPSLRVYPSASGRAAARQLGPPGADADEMAGSGCNPGGSDVGVARAGGASF